MKISYQIISLAKIRCSCIRVSGCTSYTQTIKLLLKLLSCKYLSKITGPLCELLSQPILYLTAVKQESLHSHRQTDLQLHIPPPSPQFFRFEATEKVSVKNIWWLRCSKWQKLCSVPVSNTGTEARSFQIISAEWEKTRNSIT